VKRRRIHKSVSTGMEFNSQIILEPPADIDVRSLCRDYGFGVDAALDAIDSIACSNTLAPASKSPGCALSASL